MLLERFTIYCVNAKQIMVKIERFSANLTFKQPNELGVDG